MDSRFEDLQNSHFSFSPDLALLPQMLHIQVFRRGRKNSSFDAVSIAFFISISEEYKSLMSTVVETPPFRSLLIEEHSAIMEVALSSDNKSLPFNTSPCEYDFSLVCWVDSNEILPYLSESSLANLSALSSNIIATPTESSASCLPCSVALSTAVFTTFCKTSTPSLLAPYPKIS